MSSKRDINEILPERVTQARKAAGFSISKAANQLGFNNYQILSAIEKGKRNINAHELCSMAQLYGRSLDYFFEQDTTIDPKPLWRKATDKQVKHVERRFLTFLENYSNLERLLGLKGRWKDIQKKYNKNDFATEGFGLANRLADTIGNSLKLGSRPASNLLNVLENDLRFKIIHLELKEGISAASLVDEKLGVGILINAKDAPWRRNFDLAHELFHVVTWDVFTREDVGDGTKKTKPEQFADAFAASLLLPKEQLLDSLEGMTSDRQIRIVDIIELARDFGVSTSATLWRLVGMRFLAKKRVEEILKDPDISRIDKVMRRHMSSTDKPSKFPSRYTFIASRCLLEGKISRGTFAEFLEIDRADVDDFLKKQGFLERTYERIAST